MTAMARLSKSADASEISNCLIVLLTNLHQTILENEPSNEDGSLNPTVLSAIDSVLNSIKSLRYIENSKILSDIIHAIWTMYITDFLLLTNHVNILVSDQFQQIFNSIMKVYASINFQSIFRDDTSYAYEMFFRIFNIISLPAMTSLLKSQLNDQLMPHVANILRILLLQMQNSAEEIPFKKNDLLNRESIIQLLFEYVDINLLTTDNDIESTMVEILEFIGTLVDNTILVPELLNVNCVPLILKWISLSELSFSIQRASIRLLYNIARHEKGCDALNEGNAIQLLKEFKQTTLDPMNDNSTYEDIRLLYSMTIALLAEPKESKSDVKSLAKVLDQLMQLTINTARKKNHKYGDFDISEPLVVLMKLFVHDDIVNYVLKHCQVTYMKSSSKVTFFCDLVLQFRGALVNDNELDQLTLTALMNIIWSISFHDDYIEELKSNAKFLITVKSLANDDGEDWIEQYVPKHMSSVKKAASRILWNLGQSNPAKIALVEDSPPINTEVKARSRSMSKTEKYRPHVMISYSHADTDFCQQLVQALESENLFDIWVDFAYCHTGDLWEEIGQAIEMSNVVLFLMTKDYQDSKSCRQEVMYTTDSLKKRFIPIYVKRDFMASGWLGVRIVGPQYIRFGKKSFEITFKDLVKLILDEKSLKKNDSKNSLVDNGLQMKLNEDEKSVQDSLTNGHENLNQFDNEMETTSILNDKPIETWDSNDIANWFDARKVRQELMEMYDFQYGTELLLYVQCLRSDWQTEYLDVREQFSNRYVTILYRNEFVRLVAALIDLENRYKKRSWNPCNIL